jgi:hypothetical protein
MRLCTAAHAKFTPGVHALFDVGVVVLIARQVRHRVVCPSMCVGYGEAGGKFRVHLLQV